MSYPIRYCCLRAVAEGTPYSQEYLGLLAHTGRLEAIKRERNWYTTAAAIGRYRDSLNRQTYCPMDGRE